MGDDRVLLLLLRPDEAAVALSVSRAKVYELIRRQELPVVRLGGSVRIPAEALRTWVQEHATGGR